MLSNHEFLFFTMMFFEQKQRKTFKKEWTTFIPGELVWAMNKKAAVSLIEI